MRVANVIEEGKLGGPQLRMARVAAALRGRVDTTILMPEENSEPFQAECRRLGVPFVTLPLTRITKERTVALRYLVWSPAEVLRLARALRRGGYDVVHVSGGSWQYKGLLAGKLARQRVLWHLNDTSMPWAFRAIFRVLCRLADGYVYASERSRAYYGPLVPPGKPSFVIPAPVDSAYFDPARDYRGDEELLEEWSGKLVIGSVGNINPTKSFETIIDIAAALAPEADHVVFVIVGPAHRRQEAYLAKLRQRCASAGVRNVVFAGGRVDVRALLKRFDIYLCVSLAESSPMAVWEAMAMGLPIVSTDVGDVPLCVREGENGFVVGVGDVPALARKVSALLGDESARRAMGRRSREIAVAELDIRHAVERHLEAYERAVGGEEASGTLPSMVRTGRSATSGSDGTEGR